MISCGVLPRVARTTAEALRLVRDDGAAILEGVTREGLPGLPAGIFGGALLGQAEPGEVSILLVGGQQVGVEVLQGRGAERRGRPSHSRLPSAVMVSIHHLLSAI